MTTLTLTYTRLQKKVKSGMKLIELPLVNWTAVCCTGFFVTLVLLAFYVWQINDLTRGSYLINSFQKQIDKLSQENRNLQVSFAENSFLGQAVSKVKSLNFQKTTSIKYIKITGGLPEVSKANEKVY